MGARAWERGGLAADGSRRCCSDVTICEVLLARGVDHGEWTQRTQVPRRVFLIGQQIAKRARG